MSEKRPIVLGGDGLLRQLQPGETTPGAYGPNRYEQTAVGDLEAGTPLYSAAGDQVTAAFSVDSSQSLTVGLAVAGALDTEPVTVQSDGILELSTGDWDARTGAAGGLASASPYWLSETTQGQLQAVPPTASGTYLVQVGIAISATKLLVRITEPVLIP